MPYIKKEDRPSPNVPWSVLMSGWSPTPGFLNYVFTVLARNYVASKGESYQSYNDVIGALECAKLELYRRRVTPYEEIKRDLNGDV